jgi:3-isopropylmalate dehydratase small subunit
LLQNNAESPINPLFARVFFRNTSNNNAVYLTDIKFSASETTKNSNTNSYFPKTLSLIIKPETA